MTTRAVRASWCFAVMALGVVAGCAAHTDDTAGTDEAVGGDGPPPSGDSCGGPTCSSRLREDPVVTCDRNVVAAVADSHGVVHNESLYVQLGEAAGIASAQLQPLGKNVCASPAYDCSGVFYDAGGKAMRVPPFPTATARTDEDVKRWKASVTSFYRSAYTDPRAHAKLSPGKAALCTTWAEINWQTHPDPSILDAFDTLQELGAESSMPDVTWLDNINAASIAHRCGALPLPPNHDMDSWLVPEQSARLFVAEFGDCNQANVAALGRCPHRFDPNNFVKARNIVDARSCSEQATWVIGDPTGGCGMSCYRVQ